MPSYVVIFLLAHKSLYSYFNFKSLYSYLRTSRYIPTSSRYIPTCAQVVIFLLQVVIFLLQVVIFLLQVVISLLAHKSLYSYFKSLHSYFKSLYPYLRTSRYIHKPSYSYFPSRILRVRVLLGLACHTAWVRNARNSGVWKFLYSFRVTNRILSGYSVRNTVNSCLRVSYLQAHSSRLARET